MTPQDDELNKRRQRRDEMRKKREAEQRRLRAGLVAAGVIAVICAVGLFWMARKNAPGKLPRRRRPRAIW